MPNMTQELRGPVFNVGFAWGASAMASAGAVLAMVFIAKGLGNWLGLTFLSISLAVNLGLVATKFLRRRSTKSFQEVA